MAGGINIASLFATIGVDISGLTKGMKEAKGSLDGFGINLAKQALGVASFSTAIGLAGKFVADSVSDWADYADSMRLSAETAGITVDEMSKLVQAADDFRVPIDKMQSAMEMALKNGFIPTISNLAELSDKLLAIEDPANRAAAASKIFGKSYADMMPFLLAGGDAIKGATDDIDDNLVVTEEAAVKAKEFKDAMDDLGDTWQGLKYVLGEALAPSVAQGLQEVTNELSETVSIVRLLALANDALGKNKINLVEFSNILGDTMGDTRLPGFQEEINKHLLELGLALNKSTPEVVRYRAEQKKLGDELISQSSTWEEYRDALIGSNIETDLLSKSQYLAIKNTVVATSSAYDYISAQEGVVGAVKKSTSVNYDWASSNYDLSSTYVQLGKDIVSTTDDVDDLNKSFREQQAAMTGQLADAYVKLRVEVTSFQKGVAQSLADAVKNSNFSDLKKSGMLGDIDAFFGTTYKLEFDFDVAKGGLAEKFLAGGDLSELFPDFSAMWQPLMTGADEAQAEIDLLQAKLKILTSQKYNIDITINTTGSLPNAPTDNWTWDAGTGTNGRAAGGIAFGNTPYIVGERGPELFVPDTTGRVISNDKMGAMGETITNNYVLNMPTTANAGDVKMAFELMEAWA